MTNINQNIEKTFDWDNIDTGNFLLDHSQNFFARPYNKFENFDNLKEFVEANKENALSLLNALEHNEASALSTDHNENKAAKPRKSEFPAGLPHLRIQDQSELPAGLEYLKVEDVSDENNRIIVLNEGSFCEEELIEVHLEDALENDNENMVKPDVNLINQPATKNVMLEWSTVVTSKHKHVDGASVSAPPKAYDYKDIYQQKKEEVQRKRSMEERKMREFHSRPAPNFKALHKHTQTRPIVHHITCPVTPDTLKTSRAAEERLKKKREENMHQQEIQKPKPRSVAYLQEQPFQPKHGAPTCLEQKPFRLHLDQRVRKRREYNAAVQRTQEEKSKQVDSKQEEREKREMDEKRELRKMTQFKARPNPFK